MPIQADSNGVIRGKFTIPANVPSGNKQVVVVGAGGQSGRAIFSGQGQLEHKTYQQQTTITETRWQSPPPPPPTDWMRGSDPLAQTFTLNAASQIVGVDLYFTAVPTTDVTVQIRETIAGVPSQTVLATCTLKPAAINLTGWIRFGFPGLLTLVAGIEYAFVVLCGDAVGAINVAEIGKFDSSAQKWITDQPYNVGVMLSSSNASTWTAHQDRDITFRLLGAAFMELQHDLDLGAVAVTAATDLMLLSYANRPDGQSDVQYFLTLPDGTVLTVTDGQPVQLAAAITGNVGIKARLKGGVSLSPVLHPGTQLVVGKVAATGTYVTRAIPGGSNVTVKVVFEAFVPSGSTITVEYKGPDVGDTWAAITSPTTAPANNGYVEFTYIKTAVNEASVQIRLTLNGTTAARPRVRDLRAFVM